MTVSKTKLREQFPWLVFIWCITHQLELAWSGTLSTAEFVDVNEMLLRKSPQNLNQWKCALISGAYT